MGKLNALKVKRTTKRGMYGDGHGLYLQVAKGGTAGFTFRYKRNGRTRHLGLGPTHTISLAQARERAAAARRLLLDGVDPIEHRRAARAAARLEAAKTMTFEQCATGYIDAHKAKWSNARHASQWETTLKTFAFPIFGALPVRDIDTSLIMKVLEPLWTTRTVTASRLRGRIEVVLDWARVRGFREGENPARWKGHLKALLPAHEEVRKVEHHAALPYAALPDFMATLRARQGVVARALEFAILVAGRSGEVIGARWSEIEGATWVIPGERMKSGNEHRVPLSDRALEILAEMRQVQDGEFVFPGQKPGRRLADASLLKALHRMGRDDLSMHGFRSTFRTWCAERTNYPSEVAEAALAHAVSDKVLKAYQRTTFYDRRVRLMNDWAQACSELAGGGTVVTLHG